MRQKVLVVVLGLLCAFSMIAGCGGGGTSSSVPFFGSPGAAETMLAWEAPSTNTDGAALTDLEGFRVHYGTSPGNYSESVDVGRVTSCALGLLPGVYYIAVTAYNSGGIESEYSNEVEKTIL